MRIIALALALWASLPAAGLAAAAEQELQLAGRLFAPFTDGARLEPDDLDPAIPTPADFLGYALGSRFTRHDQVLDYLEHLDAVSERLRLEGYGETYEGRRLVLVTATSPENLARLDEIRQGILGLSRPQELSASERQRLVEHLPAVVWLAYGVHGNESSSTEVAMAVAYTLAAARGDLAAALDRVVVILDPLVNPDGRERYVQGFIERRGRQPDPAVDALEHSEPWPGGRFNHYLFDLNRDWTWATQIETRQRLAAYRRWEPQVYADFHEMGSESSYFFPPPADPVLQYIDRRTVAWLEIFGRANAAAFDSRGWLYYKAEVFDLFYPGYGDSYPALRGAVGMTYEVAGGGRGGQVVERPDGLLTLADRIARHYTTSLATILTAARHRRSLLSDFSAARAQSLLDPVTTYLWRADETEAQAMADLLELHGIEVRRLTQAVEASLVALSSGASTPTRLPAGTFAVSTAQPLGGLVRALLSREAEMPASFLERQRQRLESFRDTEFADITAWSLPLAYGVEAWMMSGEPAAMATLEAPRAGLRGNGEFAFLVPPQGYRGYRFAAELARLGIRHRLSLAELRQGSERFAGGTLVIPAAGNPPALAETLGALAAELSVDVVRASTAATDIGPSLGSDQVIAIRPPRVGLLGGPGVDRTAHGALWHLFDQQLHLSFSRLSLELLDGLDLKAFDVLIFPGGNAEAVLDSATRARLARWVEEGGFLIADADALDLLRELKLSAIEEWKPGEVPGGATPAGEDPETPASPDSSTVAQDPEEARYSGGTGRPLEVPGAAFASETLLDGPLALGLRRPPAVMVLGDRVLRASGDPRKDLLLVRHEDPVIAGFAWPESVERLADSLLASIESNGRGRVMIFAQVPGFRGFWRATTPLLLNAVLYGPSLVEAGALP